MRDGITVVKSDSEGIMPAGQYQGGRKYLSLLLDTQEK